MLTEIEVAAVGDALAYVKKHGMTPAFRNPCKSIKEFDSLDWMTFMCVGPAKAARLVRMCARHEVEANIASGHGPFYQRGKSTEETGEKVTRT